jgi:hypothetical protein
MTTAKRRIERLIFVFNADTGSFNAFLDSAKKFLKIKGCTLCSITHSLAGEKSEWRDCKEEIGLPVDYVHRDELSGELRSVVGDKLPCVVAATGNDLILLLAPDVLERCQGSVADLKGRLNYFASIHRLEMPPLIQT